MLVRVNVLVCRIVVVTTEAESPVPMVKVAVDSSTVVLIATSSLLVTVDAGPVVVELPTPSTVDSPPVVVVVESQSSSVSLVAVNEEVVAASTGVLLIVVDVEVVAASTGVLLLVEFQSAQVSALVVVVLLEVVTASTTELLVVVLVDVVVVVVVVDEVLAPLTGVSLLDVLEDVQSDPKSPT